MKKFISIAAFLVLSVTGFAQSEVYFEVGPYEVEYKSIEDYRFRLRKGIDLYNYYKLKKDTVIQSVATEESPFQSGFQLGINLETGLRNKSRYSNVFAINGSWKYLFSENMALNAGLSVGMAVATVGIEKYSLLELGVPLSVEYSKLSHGKASLYGGFGLIPTFYSTLSTSYDPKIGDESPEKRSGFYLAPQVDFGGYVPAGKNFVRIGIFFKYKINFSSKDTDVYYQALGNSYFGTQVGLVF